MEENNTFLYEDFIDQEDVVNVTNEDTYDYFDITQRANRILIKPAKIVSLALGLFALYSKYLLNGCNIQAVQDATWTWFPLCIYYQSWSLRYALFPQCYVTYHQQSSQSPFITQHVDLMGRESSQDAPTL